MALETTPPQQDGYSSSRWYSYLANLLSGAGSIVTNVAATFNSTPPTLTSGQSGPLQSDANGNLKVAGSFSAATTGQYNTTLPTVTSGNSGPLQTDSSGRLLVGGVAGTVTVTFSGLSVGITGALPTGANVIGAVTQSGTWNVGSITTLPAIPAGEAHVGEVGGNVAKFQAQFGPASSTTYTAGQVMSAAIQVTGMGRVANGTGLITSATLVLNVANTNQVDLVFFSSAPTGTYTAGSTFAIGASDLVKVSKVIKLTDWTALATAVSVGEPSPTPKFYRCDDATNTQSLWVVPVARGSITLAAATDATLTVRAARN